MFIVWGKYYERRPKGWTAQECPRCKRVRPFLLEEVYQKDHLYFIVLGTTKIGEFITCHFCETNFALPKKNELAFDPGWEPSSGVLSTLVEHTNRQLGQVPEPGALTADELDLLLTVAAERATASSKDVAAGAGLGILGGVPLLGAVGWILWLLGVRIPSFDLVGQVLGVGVLGGAFFGILVGGLWWGRRKRHRVLREELWHAMSKHNLDVKRLRQAALADHRRHRLALEVLGEG